MTLHSLLLTREELEALTGKRQSAAMTSWLHRRNWVYEEADRAGDIPKVARAYFDAKMTGAPLPGQRSGPRLGFMFGSATT